MHVIATAGHVDHGKSTLIRLLTGMEPDRWSEEHRRGMTIDLGFAWTRGADTTLAFVDVPGHERFVPNMLAGIGPAPAVLFVVAADEGWMPQSTEHLDALDAFGVRHGLLAVTRCDLAAPEEAIEQAQQHLRHSSLGNVPVVRVSGVTGAGIEDLRRELDALTARLPHADPDADLRLWVDRAFTIRGAGTVVTGTLPAGTLRVGQQLTLHPSGREVSVRGLHCLGVRRERVPAVARVGVNLRGVTLDDVGRGDALLAPGRWLSTEVLDVRLLRAVAEDLPRELTLHVGSAAVTARIRPLGSETARLTLRDSLPLRIGDHALLRDPGSHQVSSGVVVLDVRPPALTRRGAARQRAQELATRSEQPDSAAELRYRRLVRTDELRAMGATPPSGSAAGDWLLDPAYRAKLAERLVEILTQYRRDHPLESGMPTEAARRELGLPEAEVLSAVLREPTASAVSLQSGRLRLGGSELPEHVQAALSKLRPVLEAEPFAAPTAEDLSALGLGNKEIAAAARAGELLRIGPGLVLLPSAERQAVATLSELASPFTLSAARKALSTTRRVAVPLLEWLAQKGYTERLPDGTHRVR